MDRHQQCIEALKMLGALTAREVSEYLYAKGYCKIQERNIAHPRLKELLDQGIVKKIGKKYDSTTKKNVNLYSLL